MDVLFSLEQLLIVAIIGAGAWLVFEAVRLHRSNTPFAVSVNWKRTANQFFEVIVRSNASKIAASWEIAARCTYRSGAFGLFL